MNMDYHYLMPKDVKFVNKNPILILKVTEKTNFKSENWMSIPRVPIYIFDIIRRHASMTNAHFLWRTHRLTQNDFKAGVPQYVT